VPLITTKIIRIEGLSETVAGLRDEFSKATAANVVRRALLAGAQPMAETAEALAPRGPTGNLIASISATPAQPSRMTRTGRGSYDKQSEVEVLVEAGPVPESVFQEFGTRHHRAQPFMRPAFDSEKANSLAIIIKQMAVEIEKARQRAARKAARIAAKIG
jgi:HK97 gp10 family phage protein